MALDHVAAVPLLMGGAVLVAGMLFLASQSNARHTALETHRRREAAGKAWERSRQASGGGDPVSELLIALSHCLAIRAGLTPSAHTIFPAPPTFSTPFPHTTRTDRGWSFRWAWSVLSHPSDAAKVVPEARWALHPEDEEGALAVLFQRRDLRCPSWLLDAVRERSKVDGMQAVYGQQDLVVHTRKATPSAHLALQAQARLQSLLPHGLDLDKALEELGLIADGKDPAPPATPS